MGFSFSSKMPNLDMGTHISIQVQSILRNVAITPLRAPHI